MTKNCFKHNPKSKLPIVTTKFDSDSIFTLHWDLLTIWYVTELFLVWNFFQPVYIFKIQLKCCYMGIQVSLEETDDKSWRWYKYLYTNAIVNYPYFPFFIKVPLTLIIFFFCINLRYCPDYSGKKKFLTLDFSFRCCTLSKHGSVALLWPKDNNTGEWV